MDTTEIKIAGIRVPLSPLERDNLRGLNMDTMMRFSYYMGSFNGMSMCFLSPKANTSLTPLQYRRYADRIGEALNLPIVFILDSITYLYRTRLIEQGVYFVVSDKYVFLPTLIINAQAKQKKSKRGKLLSPSAQYILLYYLQSQLDTDCTIKDFEQSVPFSYQSIGRALIDLENFDLCKSEVISNVEKRIYFPESKRELWNKAQTHMRNPVRWIYYTDDELPQVGVTSGINALSHYSHLNPEQMQTIAISEKDFKVLIKDKLDLNEIEGNNKIEVWIYPPKMVGNYEYADKLSLYLSMQDEHDARIEKELEIIIEKMSW